MLTLEDPDVYRLADQKATYVAAKYFLKRVTAAGFEDVKAAAMARIVMTISAFDSSRASLDSYLVAQAYCGAIDYVREVTGRREGKRKMRHMTFSATFVDAVDSDMSGKVMSPSHDPTDDLGEKIDRDLVLRRVWRQAERIRWKQLSERQRNLHILQRRYRDGARVEEIGREFGITAARVSQIATEGCQKLSKHFSRVAA